MPAPRVCIDHGPGDWVALYVDDAAPEQEARFEELEFHRCGLRVDADVLNPRCKPSA